EAEDRTVGRPACARSTTRTTANRSSSSAEFTVAVFSNRAQSAGSMHAWIRSYIAVMPSISDASAEEATFANFKTGIDPALYDIRNVSPKNGNSSWSAGFFAGCFLGTTRPGEPEVERKASAGTARRDLEVRLHRDERLRRRLLERALHLTAAEALVADQTRGPVEALPAHHDPDLRAGGGRVDVVQGGRARAARRSHRRSATVQRPLERRSAEVRLREGDAPGPVSRAVADRVEELRDRHRLNRRVVRQLRPIL